MGKKARECEEYKCVTAVRSQGIYVREQAETISDAMNRGTLSYLKPFIPREVEPCKFS